MAGLSAAVPRDVKVLGLICAPHMLSHAYFVVLAPLMPVFVDVFGVSYTEFGLAMTLFGVAAGIGQTPMGFWVDRLGGKRILIAGITVESTAIGLIGTAGEFWQVIVLFTVAGAAHTVYHPADYAILSNSVPEKRLGRAFGLHSFTGNVGFAIAPVFMLTLNGLWGWRAAFFAIGGIGLLCALALFVYGHLLDDRAATADHPGRFQTPSGSSTREGIALLLSLPILMCFLFFVMQMMGLGGLRQFLVGGLDALHNTPLRDANMALTGLMVGSALGILAGADWADRAGPRIATAVFTLVPAAALIFVAGAMPLSVGLLTACLAGAGFLQGFLVPSRDLLIRSVTPDGSMGKVMGFVSSGANLAGGLVPLLFGIILDLHHPAWMFWISAVFIGGALFTFITVRGRFV